MSVHHRTRTATLHPVTPYVTPPPSPRSNRRCIPTQSSRATTVHCTCLPPVGVLRLPLLFSDACGATTWVRRRPVEHHWCGRGVRASRGEELIADGARAEQHAVAAIRQRRRLKRRRPRRVVKIEPCADHGRVSADISRRRKREKGKRRKREGGIELIEIFYLHSFTTLPYDLISFPFILV